MSIDDEGECFNCGEPILWFKTERGKNIPIDPDPLDPKKRTAKFQIDPDDEDVVVFVPKDERMGRMYSCHFDTCMDPEQVARRKAEQEEWKRNNPR